MWKTNLGKLRIAGFLEGISLIVLLGVCMPMKYLWDIPDPTKYVGTAHGLLFILYCILLAIVTFETKWGFRLFIFSFLASIIPFGTFLADQYIFKKYSEKLIREK